MKTWMKMIAWVVLAFGGYMALFDVWPWNAVGAAIAVAAIAGLVWLKYYYKPKAKAKPPEPKSDQPAEAEVYRTIENHKKAALKRFWQMIGAAIASIVFLVIACYFIAAAFWVTGLIFLASLFGAILTLAASIGFVAAAYAAGNVMTLEMGHVGWWFVLVPEMHAAIVEIKGSGVKGTCYKIIICCNDPKRRAHFEKLVKTDEELYVLLEPHKALHALDWYRWPWRYRLREPWYDSIDDAVNPDKGPNRYVYLGVIPLTLDRKDKEHPDGIVEPVFSRDPIDIAGALFLEYRVNKIYETAYKTKTIGESIIKPVLACWREVAAGLSYFKDKPEDKGSGKADSPGDYREINPAIQEQAPRCLLKALGMLSKPDSDKPDFDPMVLGKDNPLPDNHHPEIKIDAEGKVVFSEHGEVAMEDDFEPYEGVAASVLREYGYELVGCKVLGLGPARSAITEALESKSEKEAKAAAEVETAKGDAKITRLLAAAEADAIRDRADALSKPGGREIWQGDITTKVVEALKTAKNTFVVGGDATAGKAATVATVFSGIGGLQVNTGGKEASAEAEPEKPKDEGAPKAGATDPGGKPDRRPAKASK